MNPDTICQPFTFVSDLHPSKNLSKDSTFQQAIPNETMKKRAKKSTLRLVVCLNPVFQTADLFDVQFPVSFHWFLVPFLQCPPLAKVEEGEEQEDAPSTLHGSLETDESRSFYISQYSYLRITQAGMFENIQVGVSHYFIIIKYQLFKI